MNDRKDPIWKVGESLEKIETFNCGELPMNDRIQEIRARHDYDKALYAPKVLMSPPYKDRAYLLSEVERLIGGYEVLAQTPMTAHPSETRDFAKRILKGESPHKLNESTLSHLKG